jgi:hypothetical protein
MFTPTVFTAEQDNYLWNVSNMMEPTSGSSSQYALRAVDKSTLYNESHPEEFWSAAFTVLHVRDDAISSTTLEYSSTSTPAETRTTPTMTPTSTQTESIELSGLPRISPNAQVTPTSTGSAFDSSTKSQGGLSFALTVGLAGTFTVGSIAIAIYLLVLLYKRRKRNAKKPKLVSTAAKNADEHLPEVCTYEPVPHGSPTNPLELEVKPVEMEGTRTYAELPAEARRLPTVEDLDELVIEPRR